MPETVFYRFVPDGIEWLHFNVAGQLLRGATSTEESFKADFASDSFGGSAICVAPGEAALQTRASIPSRQQRQIVQAVPYVVEERLATDPDDCFFALGGRNAEGDLEVAVIEQERMASLADKIASVLPRTSVLVTETSLARTDAKVSALVDADRVHVALSNGSGVTMAISDLPLAMLLAGETENLELWVNEAARGELDLALNELAASELEINVEVSAETPFERLCRNFDGSEINLLQGPYKVVAKTSRSGSVWRSAAILLGAAVLVHLLIIVGESWYLAQRAAQFEAEALAIYKKHFPNDRNVRDLRRRWNARLGRQDSTDSEFIALFAQSSRGLMSAGLTLSNVNFNESRGDLILQVEGRRSEELVQYAQQLTGQGISAEIGTITQEGDGVRGSIKVKAGGAVLNSEEKS